MFVKTVEQLEFDTSLNFKIARLDALSMNSILVAFVLGIALSVLFYMDQNITTFLIHQPTNNLKKPEAYHLDLFVLALINFYLSLYGLPFMHSVLPQSPMNIRGLADLDESVPFQPKITNVRETRLTTIIMNIMIYFTLYLTPYPLANIPTPVLDGLFLYCAIATLRGNSFVDRLLLIFTGNTFFVIKNYY